MSKWSKRSDEEKKNILKDQQKMRDEAERKKNRGTFAILKDEDALAIYDKKEIPLPCLECGWTGSDNYQRIKKTFAGIYADCIEGKCRKCGKMVTRALPSPLETEGMMFMLTMNMLAQQGRLK
jgi:hypothetical protein